MINDLRDNISWSLKGNEIQTFCASTERLKRFFGLAVTSKPLPKSFLIISSKDLRET